MTYFPSFRTQAEELTYALDGHWSLHKRQGKACCPAHNDANPSLTISVGKKRPIVLYCFSGCKQAAIIAALKQRGLWPGPGGAPTPPPGGGSVNPTTPSAPSVVVSTNTAPPAPTPRFGETHFGRWEYRSADGGLIYVKDRYDSADGTKRYCPLTPEEVASGGVSWKVGDHPSPKPLYRLDALAQQAGQPVLIVEGEKTCDAAIALFPTHVVVTWPNGANGVGQVDLNPLDDRDVTIWPDADEPGRAAAKAIAQRLIERGQFEVKIVDVPATLPKGWDLADTLPAGTPAAWYVETLKAATHAVENIYDAPIDIFAQVRLTSYSADCFPAVIDAYARDKAELIGTGPLEIASACIAVASGMISRGISVQPKVNDTSWTEKPILWVILIAEPGLKKSPAFDAAIAPAWGVEFEWGKHYIAEYQRWKTEREIFEATKAAALKAAKKNPSLQPPNQIEPKEPVRRRRIIVEATTEAIGAICAETNDRLLCAVEEANLLFANEDIYRQKSGSQKDRTFWLMAYGGRPHAIDRRGAAQLQIAELMVSVVGTIQPDVMRKRAASFSEDGFIARMIPIHIDVSYDDLDRVPNSGVAAAYQRVIERLARIPRPDPAHVLKMSSGAQSIRKAFRGSLKKLRLMQQDQGRILHHMNKWEGLLVRIALVYELIEWANGASQQLPAEVSAPAARQARNFMLKVLGPNVQRFYMQTLGDVSTGHARWIADHILAHRLLSITARHIKRVYKRLETKEQERELFAAMDLLETAGVVLRDETSGSNGSVSWKVNPRFHLAHKARATAARKRREAQRVAICNQATLVRARRKKLATP